jgi:broad specificity phosphatase PhoE
LDLDVATVTGTSPAASKWPARIWIARHGQSSGNVARDRAEAAGDALIDTLHRDVDTPLSELGQTQAAALGRWFGALPANEQPNRVLCSPYLRARTTMELLLDHAGADVGELSPVVDERLREKEFGITDRLTARGIRERYPDLAAQRAAVGKFYFRPPGGESWCDVILRLRSLIDTLTRDYRGDRLLIVTHQVVVNCLRYLFERLDEARVLDLDRAADVPNCGITSYVFDPRAGRQGKLVLDLVNFVSPLEQAGAPLTTEADLPASAKP